MTPAESTSTALGPVEAHVHAQVAHLAAVVAVFRALLCAEEQYAEAYADLPFFVAVETKLELARLPQLQRVCSTLGQFVRKSAVLKATVAKELLEDVLTPLENFRTDHVTQAKHVLSELYELLQKEKAFDEAYQQLHARFVLEGLQDGGLKHNMQKLRQKRDTERLTIRQWLTVLHYADKRLKTHIQDATSRTLAIYEQMARASQKLVQEAKTRVDNECDRTITADVLKEQLEASKLNGDDNNASEVVEEIWMQFLRGYDCHTTMTCWMSELFKRVVPVENAMSTRLRGVQELDCATVNVFGEALLDGFCCYHTLLTVSVLDPIVRTLLFSSNRQQRMRHVLVQDPQGETSSQRSKLAALRARAEKMASPRSLRFSSKSRDNNECERNPEVKPRQLRSRPEEARNLKLQGLSRTQSPSELTPELVELRPLERKEVVQCQETARALQQTAFVSVKTLELMVKDRLKHVSAALASLSEALHTRTKTASHPNEVKAALPWDHLKERFAVRDYDQLPDECNAADNTQQDAEDEKEASGCVQLHPFCSAQPEDFGRAATASLPATCTASWSPMKPFHALCRFLALLLSSSSEVSPKSQDIAALAVVAAVLLLLVRTCVRADQLQASWNELGDLQLSNSQTLAQIVELSLHSCARQRGKEA